MPKITAKESLEQVASAARDLRRQWQADPRTKFPTVAASFADVAAVVNLIERLARAAAAESK